MYLWNYSQLGRQVVKIPMITKFDTSQNGIFKRYEFFKGGPSELEQICKQH